MKKLFLTILGLICTWNIYGQGHEGHNHKDHSEGKKQEEGHDHSMHSMPHAFSRNLPMNRNGSGTSWHPDNSPMYMLMWHAGTWNLMMHYNVFGVYTWENFNNTDKRSESGYTVPNWAMLMATHAVGEKGQVLLRTMVSADPLTVGGFGYPMLYQTGETWKGSPLVDRQHPHDLISELAVGYSHSFNTQTDLYAYFGLPGEPALGPPVFMHRPSALNIFSSPLGHHWQDATHITFGVGTIGFRYGKVKVEGSIFTGKEPDENRYNFDKPRFDSYSGRISWNPLNSLAIQASAGYLKEPENFGDPHDKVRISASVLHNWRTDSGSVLSTAAVWGMNIDQPESGGGDAHAANSWLLESAWQAKGYNLFLRTEVVQKNARELQVLEGNEHNVFTIFSAGIGGSVYILKTKGLWVDLGAMGRIFNSPEMLKPYYGNLPLSAEVFLRLIPSRM